MKIAEVTFTNKYSLASRGRKSTELKQTRECAHTNIITDEQRKNWQLLILLDYQEGKAHWISTLSFFSWSQHLDRNHSLKMSKTWFLISPLPPSNTQPSLPLPHTDSWSPAAWIARTSKLKRVTEWQTEKGQIVQDSSFQLNQSTNLTVALLGVFLRSVQSPLPPSTHGPSSGSWVSCRFCLWLVSWYLVLSIPSISHAAAHPQVPCWWHSPTWSLQ